MEKNRAYIVSVFSENQAGVLNRITSVFLRRKINIESLKVSETSVKGISMFTIEASTSESVMPLLVCQIEKIIEVIRAEYCPADEQAELNIQRFLNSLGSVLNDPDPAVSVC